MAVFGPIGTVGCGTDCTCASSVSCYVPVQVYIGCEGFPASAEGLAVTVLSGETTVASGMTDSTGFYNVQLACGTYTVLVVYNGITASVTQDFTGTNPTGPPAAVFYIIGVWVLGCEAIGVEGAEVTITGLGPAQTTNSSGYTPTGWITPLDTANTYSIACDRFADATGAITMPCQEVELTAGEGYACALNCNLPIEDTLDFTDSCLGSSTATYDGPTGYFVGSLAVSVPAYDGCPAYNSTVTYYLAGAGSYITYTAPGGTSGPVIAAASRTCPPSFVETWTLGIPGCSPWYAICPDITPTVTFTEA